MTTNKQQIFQKPSSPIEPALPLLCLRSRMLLTVLKKVCNQTQVAILKLPKSS